MVFQPRGDIMCPKRTATPLRTYSRVEQLPHCIVSNALLLNLPIHSIHHLVPKRPFPVHNAFFHTQLAHDAAVPLQIARARRRFLYTRSRDALQQPLA